MDPDLIQGISIPIVVLAVFLGVRSIRRRVRHDRT